MTTFIKITHSVSVEMFTTFFKDALRLPLRKGSLFVQSAHADLGTARGCPSTLEAPCACASVVAQNLDRV